MINLATLLKIPKGVQDTQWQILAGPILILLILSMMVLPLPAFILDLLFTFNIALSIMVLLVAMFTKRVLDFAAFPTILLFATLLRLSLNVASTRIILLDGHRGAEAAGRVVEAFGHFLVGGNFTIGIVVFIILVLINFMVITKGAGRIAEVGARFVLDGMPGKQMAIDADLNAGIISEDEAKKRRIEVTQEADFYGSMDGASKFVRGDAIVGIMIMVINVVGGLIIGVGQHDLTLGDAISAYTLLTIGDGLVAQIPALIISTAAGVIVTRVATDEDVGEQMVSQLFNNPRVMWLSAGILGLIGLIPGMPNFVFLLFTAILAGLGWYLLQKTQCSKKTSDEVQEQLFQEKNNLVEATWEDVQLEDVLAMEVGYRLIPLVDKEQQGELLGRIRGLRKKFAKDIGYLPPVIHICDNLELSPCEYRILIKGAEVGRGEVQPERMLAIDPGNTVGTLDGDITNEPAFGLPSIWIDEDYSEQAQTQGYTVVSASTAIATHFNQILLQNSSILFGRQEAQMLYERVKKELPKLSDDLIPEIISLSILHRVLQNLLSEDISIRDMQTILETLIEMVGENGENKQIDYLTAKVRIALGRSIVQQLFGNEHEYQVIGLDTYLEQILLQAAKNGGAIEPNLANFIQVQVEEAINHQERMGVPIVLVVHHELRLMLSRFLRRTLPQLTVISHLELNTHCNIKVTSLIKGE